MDENSRLPAHNTDPAIDRLTDAEIFQLESAHPGLPISANARDGWQDWIPPLTILERHALDGIDPATGRPSVVPPRVRIITGVI